MKTLLFIAAALSSSISRYDLHGERADALDNEMPSCGASERLIKDHYAVVIDWTKRTATVNRTPWALAFSDDAIILTHEASPDAHTKLAMYIEPHDDHVSGRLVLTGFTEHRDACADRITLTGR